jgi:hypothetical protein
MRIGVNGGDRPHRRGPERANDLADRRQLFMRLHLAKHQELLVAVAATPGAATRTTHSDQWQRYSGRQPQLPGQQSPRRRQQLQLLQVVGADVPLADLAAAGQLRRRLARLQLTGFL